MSEYFIDNDFGNGLIGLGIDPFKKKLKADRMEYCTRKLTEIGVKFTFKDETELRFEFNGETVKFFPYSGWATGKTIKDGRGFEKLLRQIKN